MIGREHFGPYLRNQKYRICVRIQQILYNFFIDQIQKKLMTQIQKTLVLVHFWPIFPIFGTKKFSWKIQLSRTTSYGFLAPCQNLEKVNDTIQRKRPDRRTEGRTEGRKDGQTFFYRTLPATAGGPKSDKIFLIT